MKVFKFFLLAVLACCFSGCLDITEQITVKENGSGEFALNMDMSKVVDMMQAFMPPDQMKELENARDTTINLKDIADTSSALSADQKALMKDATLRMQMNMAEKILKIDMTYPFKNMSDLQKLYTNLGEAGTNMGAIMNGINPSAPAPPTGGRDPEMKMISAYFDLETKSHSITRKLNKEKYAKLNDDAMLQQMKQMGEMAGALGATTMNTVIKLSSPAKKITGSKAELSADKKIVMLKNELMNIFDHPEVFEFTIEY